MPIHSKKLVYHFYAKSGLEKSPVYAVHKYFLTKYSCVFDYADFYVVVDDVNDRDIIESAERFLVGCGFNDIRFCVRKNTGMCEVETLKTAVLDKLDKIDEMVFFGHNKGIMDYEGTDVTHEDLLVWITALYYLSLEFHKEAEWSFYSNRSFFYGSLMELFENGKEDAVSFPVNNWFYRGTFYWINCSAISAKMKGKIPYPYNRFYAENLPGNMCKPYDYEAYTHNYMMIPGWKYDKFNENLGRVECVLNDKEMEDFHNVMSDLKTYLNKNEIVWD